MAQLRSTLISRRQFRDGLKSHLFTEAYFWSSKNIRFKRVSYLLTYLLTVNHKHSDFDCAQLERQTMSNGKRINVNVFDQSKSRLKFKSYRAGCYRWPTLVKIVMSLCQVLGVLVTYFLLVVQFASPSTCITAGTALPTNYTTSAYSAQPPSLSTVVAALWQTPTRDDVHDVSLSSPRDIYFFSLFSTLFSSSRKSSSLWCKVCCLIISKHLSWLRYPVY